MSFERELRGLSDALVRRIPELVTIIRDRLLVEVPAYADSADPALLDTETSSIVSSLRTLAGGLARGRTEAAGIPGSVEEETRIAAQAGLDLQALIQTHRVAQSATWEVLLEEADTLIADERTRSAVLRLASRFHFDWNDRVNASVVTIYQGERDLQFRDRERRRQELVRDLLAGLPIDSSSLSYDLRGEHLCVMAWGRVPGEAISALTAEHRGTTLTVSGPGDTLIAWIGAEQLQRPRRPATRVPDATFVALGQIASGESGFRLSHRQALQASRVARAQPRPATEYATVALEALVLRDAQALRDFVTYELGPLLGPDPRNVVLRETLRAYFATGQNGSSAAHLLGIHERTVAYRLRSIEERLGVPVSARRDELSAALRFSVFLDPALSSTGGTEDVPPADLPT